MRKVFKNAMVQGRCSRREGPACVISVQPPNNPLFRLSTPQILGCLFVTDCLPVTEQRVPAEE
jgi:hypothetical protein